MNTAAEVVALAAWQAARQGLERTTTMEYTRLGSTGLKVSRLALGCMSYGDPTTQTLTPGH